MNEIPVKLNNDVEPQALVCPWCDYQFTHQGKVEVFSREEDATIGAHAVIHGGETRVDSHVEDGNPSRRRSGLRVTMECEGCERPFHLCIVQHKGWTLVYIEGAKPPLS